MLNVNQLQRRQSRRPFIALLLIIGGVLLFASPFGNTPTSEVLNNGGVKTERSSSEANSCNERARAYNASLSEEPKTIFTLEHHEYLENGLLKVNSNGPHPIFELVRRAQKNWDKKLRSGSRTLEEAVTEYRKRYKRAPPRGFDDWWEYVVENNVQLPDEYDQIMRDLEPFWGMDPKDLKEMEEVIEKHNDSYTIGKDTYDDFLSLKITSFSSGEGGKSMLANGAHQIIDLMDEVEALLPPFRAVFSPHDNPNLPFDYELKQQALEAARRGIYIDINKPPPVKLDGWVSSCSPHSPARNEHINYGDAPDAAERPKTFIHDHRASMDPCQHPSHLLLHGQFISHRKGPVPHRKMYPQFSYAPTLLHHDITPAVPISWVPDIMPREDDPEWEERYDGRLQWRGSNTGIWHSDDIRWDLTQRSRLVHWAGDGGIDGTGSLGENFTVLPSVDEGIRVGEPVQVRKASWAPGMVDIAYAGEPLNCSPELCEKLLEIFEWRKRHDMYTSGKYKYYIDVDGHAWSSRFKKLITSNALVFKSTIYPEWFTDRVEPWVHYVPIQIDLSDLWDSLSFFHGEPGGKGDHDEMASKIARDGREWSRTFWRREDMVAYMFRLFLEYARVMDPERDLMFFDLSRVKKQNNVRFKGKRRQDTGTPQTATPL